MVKSEMKSKRGKNSKRIPRSFKWIKYYWPI
jgi:hypothetical protein